jgi:aerobic-type carbon monoxide dehydrogenase small subunit (CoxS/CutS family)
MINARGEGECALDQLRILHHPVLGDLPEAEPVRLTVDGREITARRGEVLAAALLANGLRVFRTMPEGDEPRGPFCAVGRCPDCSMIVDGQPDVLTCQTEVREGMRVETQRGLGQWEPSDGDAE